jgi:predicted transcriptional regulator
VFNVITKFYKDKFGIPEDAVIKAADLPILKLFIGGFTNEEISSMLGISQTSVQAVINKYTGLKGNTKREKSFLLRYKSGDNLGGLETVIENIIALDNEVKQVWR